MDYVRLGSTQIIKQQKDKLGTLDIYGYQKNSIDSGNMFSAAKNTLYQYSPEKYSDAPGAGGLSYEGNYDIRHPESINNFSIDGYNRSLHGPSTYTTTNSEGQSTIRTDNQYIRAEKDRITAQKSGFEWARDDHFSIGTVYLRIPPVQISISNEAHTYRFSGLRMPGEVTLSSGRSTTRVNLDIVFTGLDDINNRLRPLIAQYKTTPFLPIESAYLKNILNPFDRGNSDTDYPRALQNQYDEMLARDSDVQKLLDATSSVNISNNQIRGIINDMHSKGYIDGDLQGKLTDYAVNPQNIPKVELEPTDYKKDEFGVPRVDLATWIRRHITVPIGRDTDMVYPERSLSEISRVRDEIDTVNSQASKLLIKGIDERFKDRQIVGVLSQMALSTVPGFPDTISCSLSLYVFNYDPYTVDFGFILNYNTNASTPDITQCDLFIDWYTKRWLSGNISDDRPGLADYDANPELEFTYITKMKPVGYENNGIYNKEDIEKETFTVTPDLIPTGITVSIKNIIQFLPILSSKNPTCQYMGGMNT